MVFRGFGGKAWVLLWNLRGLVISRVISLGLRLEEYDYTQNSSGFTGFGCTVKSLGFRLLGNQN